MLTEEKFLETIFKQHNNGIGWRKSDYIKSCYWHYLDDNLHRENGPAVYDFVMTAIDGTLYSAYYFHGEALSKEGWFACLNQEQKMAALFNEENW